MVFEGFNLVPTPKKEAIDPTTQRRRRMLMQIDKQIGFVESANQGRQPRGRWWTTDINGKITLAIKYGKTPLELSKGKHAIACDTMDAAKAALVQSKALVNDGVFDSQFKAVSEQIRSRFKKSKK